jgi:hypothetical protein
MLLHGFYARSAERCVQFLCVLAVALAVYFNFLSNGKIDREKERDSVFLQSAGAGQI